MTRGIRRAVAVSVAALGVSGIAAGAARIAALADVDPGEWQLKEIGGTATRTVCLADPAQLLQIEHATASCTRSVLDAGPTSVTVSYTCAGGGKGRTTLTVRTSQSLKIETQGMAGGAPFAFDYDARRIGACTMSHARPGARPVPH